MTPEQIAARYATDNPDYGPDVVRSEDYKEGYDAAVRRYFAHIDTLTAAVEPCPWCGHPPMCHKGPEGECVGENR